MRFFKFFLLFLCSISFAAQKKSEAESASLSQAAAQVEQSIGNINAANENLATYLKDPQIAFKALEQDLARLEKEKAVKEMELAYEQSRLVEILQGIQLQKNFLSAIGGNPTKSSLDRAISIYDTAAIPKWKPRVKSLKLDSNF